MKSMIGPAQPPTAASRRRARISELQRRRRRLTDSRPTAPAAIVQAIASNDAFWGPEESWRTAVSEAAADHSGHEDALNEEWAHREQDPPGANDPAPALSAPQVKKPRFQLLRRRHPMSTGQAVATGEEPTPEQLSSIPPPGGRNRVRIPGRRQTWIVRTALVAAPLMLVGGVAFAAGVSTGSARVPAAASMSPEEAHSWGLTMYPTAAAASFGQSYVVQCLTHPDPKNTTAVAARAAALSTMTSADVPQGCGWDGTGPAQRPLIVTWDGSAEPLAGYTAGQASRIGFSVTLQSGRQLRVVVPVWTPAQTPTDGSFRVVGDLGMMPVAPAAAAPVPDQPLPSDDQLATSIAPAVLTPFLAAWARSDTVQLSLLLTTNASTSARRGMQGILTNPRVRNTSVTVVRGTPGGYTDGDVVVALTEVLWASPTGGDQSATYAIRLQQQASHWLVADITGSTLDRSGGAAALQPLPTPTTTKQGEN